MYGTHQSLAAVHTILRKNDDLWIGSLVSKDEDKEGVHTLHTQYWSHNLGTLHYTDTRAWF